jgi:hypothetical protein
MKKPPKVFISYAHEGKKLADDVLAFANYLRLQGVDAEIDQYEEAPPQGWPLWMASQIDQADFVLILATETYYERSKFFEKDPSSGLGVKWETLHILQKIYENVYNNTKYIPIYFNDENKKYILDTLRPYTSYNINNSEFKERLVLRLLGKSTTIRPELGQHTPNSEEFSSLVPKPRKHLFISSLINLELWDKANWRGIAFSYAQNQNEVDIPIIGLGFEKPKIGKKIFDEINTYIKNDDLRNLIRVSIIRDIDPLHIHRYRVLIGPNEEYLNDMLEKAKLEDSLVTTNEYSLFIGISRVLEVDPQTSENLERFLNVFKEKKLFYLTNMMEKLNSKQDPSFYTKPKLLDSADEYIDFENMILKDEINIKTLSDLKKEDPKTLDFAALNAIDTRKISKKMHSNKSEKEKKAVEKRKRKAKELKKTKKARKK